MVAQRPGFKFTITSTPDQYGLLDAVVENKSQSIITAVQIAHSCTNQKGLSSSVGADSLTSFILSNVPMSQGIPPGQSMHFDVSADTAACPLSVGLLFADGHGEGNGWQRLSAMRRTSLQELSSLVELVKTLPANDEFPAALLKALNARYNHLRDLGRADMTQDDRSARQLILGVLLQGLRPPGGVAIELNSPDAAISTLDRWMTPLDDAIKREQKPDNSKL
jgi:hypothetical protein